MEITPPWDTVLLNEKPINGVLNSRGDLVCFFSDKDCDKHGPGKLDKATGELKLFSSSSEPIKTENIEYCHVAVDEDDTVYVLSLYADVGYVLSVYTKDGVIKYHCKLKKLKVRKCCHIVVTEDKRIVICCQIDYEKITVYLCKITEDQEPQMEELTTILEDISVECVFASSDEIIVATINATERSHVLYIYTEDGWLKRKFNFHPSGVSSYFISVCYNQDTKSIIGLNNVKEKIFVEYLSVETGELQHSYLLILTGILESPLSLSLACHRNGALALVSGKRVLYLQAPHTKLGKEQES